jgi:hypothetical protein
MTSEGWREAIATFVTSETVTGVVATTDGLVRIATARPEGTPHAPFFLPLLDFVRDADSDEEALVAFLSSDRVRGATSDDVTLVLAAR